MALTTPSSESLPVLPFYVQAKKTQKQTKKPAEGKPNKGTLQSKPPQGTLRGFVGILFPTEGSTCFPENWLCYTLTANECWTWCQHQKHPLPSRSHQTLPDMAQDRFFKNSYHYKYI